MYNSERWLRDCLNSVLAQTLNDIEVICVDDGSSDGSASILQEFADGDDRVVIINQENAGAGAARNSGIEIAGGEYLSFLDSDDVFAPEMLRLAYERSAENGADICIFRYDHLDMDSELGYYGDFGYKRQMIPHKECFSPADVPENLFAITISPAWNKLYRSEFVNKQGLRFQSLPVINDAFFTCTATLCASKIAVLDKILVHRRLLHADTLSSKRDRYWRCAYEVLCAVKKEADEHGLSKTDDKALFNLAAKLILGNVDSIRDRNIFITYVNEVRNVWIPEFMSRCADPAYFDDPAAYQRFQAMTSGSAEDYIFYEMKRGEQSRYGEWRKRWIAQESLSALQDAYARLQCEHDKISSLKRHIKHFISKRKTRH